MKAIIKVIPHSSQRYDTCGDWQVKKDRVTIKVSDLGNDKYNSLIALHEYIEAMLCHYRSITEQMVDEWDMNYAGPCEEPGADPNCPYFKEHVFATAVEKSMAEQLGISWDEYEKAIEALDK